jgi:uncharacterized tellurite resistance protein B-like protein
MQTAADKDKHILFKSIRLMICVGHADGYMGKKEMSRIHQMVNCEHFTLRERQILIDDIDSPKSPETIVADMVQLTQGEKLTVLRQLYHIALADRKLTEAEQKEIRRIAKLLGIAEAKLREVEEWVYEGINWRERWQQIVKE